MCAEAELMGVLLRFGNSLGFPSSSGEPTCKGTSPTTYLAIKPQEQKDEAKISGTRPYRRWGYNIQKGC